MNNDNDQYCTVDDLENFLLKDVSTGFEDQIEFWIRATTKLMDTMANRRLVAPVVGSGDVYETYYYNGDNTSYLLIDDCQSIQKVEISDTWGEDLEEIDTANYLALPKNAPHRAITLRNNIFTTGQQNIAITGNFGLFKTIPDDIRLACAIITAGIVNAQEKGANDKTSESIGNYSVSFKDKDDLTTFQNSVNTIMSYRKHQY